LDLERGNQRRPRLSVTKWERADHGYAVRRKSHTRRQVDDRGDAAEAVWEGCRPQQDERDGKAVDYARM
jgi:hypothetical protein